MTAPLPPSLTERALRRLARCYPQLALRAVLHGQRLLGFVLGVEIARRRDSAEPFQAAVAEVKLGQLLVYAYQEIAAILADHLDKCHGHRRSHYSPDQRYRILKLKQLLGLSQEETARQFRVSVATIARWEREAQGSPEKDNLGSLVRPQPPVRRFADVVRELVQSMSASGFGGNKRIAQSLARAGLQMSKDTVRRIRKEKPSREPGSEPQRSTGRAVRAKYPGHVFMVDLTDIAGLFRILSFTVAVVFDVFSRMPLSARIFLAQPPASNIAGLFCKAALRQGVPKHSVSDQGRQFTAAVFRSVLARLGILHRFGAVGKTGSIALIERFWRTMKELLMLRLCKPVVVQDLERRLGLVLAYYAYFRPHQGLGGATPAEVYFGIKPAYLAAVAPPRGRLGEGPSELPVEIAYLDPEMRLPYLTRKAA